MAIIIIQNIVPALVFTLVFAFFLYTDDTSVALIMSGEGSGAAADGASRTPQYDVASKRIIQYVFMALVIALILRWRLFVRLPIPILGSTPHAPWTKFLISEKEMGRTRDHNCNVPARRRFLVGHRFFDGGKLSSKMATSTHHVPFAVFYPCETTKPSDEYETVPWLPRGDIRVATGTSRRQHVPEFVFYHWADVKMRCISNANPHHFLIDGEEVEESNKHDGDCAQAATSRRRSFSLCSSSFPIVIFAHGDCTHCHMYSAYCIELASRGAVVIMPWFNDGSSSAFIKSASSSLSSSSSSSLDQHQQSTGEEKNENKDDDDCLWYVPAGRDPTDLNTVAIREEQVQKRSKTVRDVAQAVADLSLFEWLGWTGLLASEEKRSRLQKAIVSDFGVSIQGHLHGGATTFAVLVDVLEEQLKKKKKMMMEQKQQELQQQQQKQYDLPRIRNYIAFDLWPLPISKHLTRLQQIVETMMKSESGSLLSLELPLLELQTSDEWTFPGHITRHMELVPRLRELYEKVARAKDEALLSPPRHSSSPQQKRVEDIDEDDESEKDRAAAKAAASKKERLVFEIKRGTDHLSLCDGGLLSPRYQRHKDSKRKGMWTDDSIYICEYARGALESIIKAD